MVSEKFIDNLKKQGFALNEKQINQFDSYFKILIEENKKINLTSITQEEDVYLKHFYDSVSPVFSFSSIFKQRIKICDVGAGAGFPSIPIKILCPNVSITIVDSLNKRIKFLKLLTNFLDIDDVSLYHDRAEIFGRNVNHREKYDLVLARAVANLSVLSELCLPLTKVGGYFVAFKSYDIDEELLESNRVMSLLGAKVYKTKNLSLEGTEEFDRKLILVKKAKSTSLKYPRKPGVPNKNPL